MEDADKGPQEALTAVGASRFSILCGAVIPDALPSMINTALFALEKAVRSSVVLGLVGAGGIGQELKVAFDLFQYRSASTIMLAIFVVVLLMEYMTDQLRDSVLPDKESLWRPGRHKRSATACQCQWPSPWSLSIKLTVRTPAARP